MDSEKAPKDSHTKSQPSCELCQRRKVRCDKGNPCTTCQRAGVKCEVSSRQRLPRGRNGGRRKGDTDLKARIAKLENLISTMGSDTAPRTTSPSSNSQPAPHETTSKESTGDMSRYLGSSFWTNLSSEVTGLRDVLDETSDSDTETPERSEPASTPPSISSRGFNFVLCGPDSFMMSPNALDNPPRPMVEALFTLYIRNADPIFKVIHVPSVADFILKGKLYLDHKPGDPAVEALCFAIYYAGLNTQDERTCKQEFGEEKTDLLNKYHFALEVWLARADFIKSTEIAVLQAFVIFLASVRTNDRSRWSWTLQALAVRMAQAHGLTHARNLSAVLKPFEVEMRRRVWHQIGVLDIQAALDRGTDPMIAGILKGVGAPANVNDVDLSPNMQGPIVSRDEFTDMSFCLMSQDGEPLVRKLIYVQGGDTTDERLEIEQTWYKKQELAFQFRQVMHEKYLRHCQIDIPFHWFAKNVGEVMCSALILFAVRPLQLPPHIKPPQGKDFSVLNLAVEVLVRNQEILTNPMTQPWRWFVWVQWHPLAVALAELCSYTEGPVVDSAWEVIDTAFHHYGEFVADTERGMLWQPIEKLMRKAKQNKRIAQMGNLNLGGQTESVGLEARGVNVQPEVAMTDPSPAGQNIDPRHQAFRFSPGDSMSGIWNTGVLGPGSIDPSASIKQDGNSGPTVAHDFGNNPLLFGPQDFNNIQDASHPLDMAWTNWEDFVGDVNLADFDMGDPTAALPQLQ